MKYALILLALGMAMTGCGKTTVEAEVLGYVNKFYSYCDKYGAECDRDVSVEFDSPEEIADSNGTPLSIVLGYCNSLHGGDIKIDRSMFMSASDKKREYVIMHEMLHCSAGLDHDNSTTVTNLRVNNRSGVTSVRFPSTLMNEHFGNGFYGVIYMYMEDLIKAAMTRTHFVAPMLTDITVSVNSVENADGSISVTTTSTAPGVYQTMYTMQKSNPWVYKSIKPQEEAGTQNTTTFFPQDKNNMLVQFSQTTAVNDGTPIFYGYVYYNSHGVLSSNLWVYDPTFIE